MAVRKRKPQKSGTTQALEAITGLVGGKKAAGGACKGAKAGAGMAMLTAAAGLAFKNRDKLTSMLKRGGGAPDHDASVPPPGTTGAQVHAGTGAGMTEPRIGEPPGDRSYEQADALAEGGGGPDRGQRARTCPRSSCASCASSTSTSRPRRAGRRTSPRRAASCAAATSPT